MTMMLRVQAVLLLMLWPVSASVEEMRTTADSWVAAMRGTVDVDGGLMRLAAEREGLIAEVLVAEGAVVAAGQLLARIDDAGGRLQLRTAEMEANVARAQLAAATLRLQHAEDEVARLAPAAEAGAIPRIRMDEARRLRDTAFAEVNIAEATLSLARSRVDAAALEVAAREVRAPVGGVILRASARVGDAATTNTVTEMFLLAPDGPRVLRGMLDEQFLGKVAVGQRAVLFSERMTGAELAGRVLRIAPVLGKPGETQTEARSVQIVLGIEGEAARSLFLGERLVARFPAPVPGRPREGTENDDEADSAPLADRTAPGSLGPARPGDGPSL
jgi:HlyD family secretion protein